MTDRKSQDLAAEIRAEILELKRENDRRAAENERRAAENDRRAEESARLLAETQRVVRESGQQIGRLGDKFGSFTEGMALPSMTKILMQHFGMTTVAPRVLVRRNGRSMEIDVLAYSNSDRDEVYVVEVKSHLRQDGLDQLLKTLQEFREFFPEHAGKKLYGILAAVDVSTDVAAKALRQGIYLARIHDDQFELQVPGSFHPRAY